MTSSLANFISSLVAGGLVVAVIGVALIIISKSDRVTRS
uniref:Photosystem II reaction center protein X n=1 Tax=Plagiogramma staurophorum TaxID=1003089 RepID=A0A2U9NMF4_9STRA|nr:photosystem II protein X [Plagiogramma staurophorum]AWT38255.1 photosystem II protein X [Plagiogramma staurophorum]